MIPLESRIQRESKFSQRASCSDVQYSFTLSFSLSRARSWVISIELSHSLTLPYALSSFGFGLMFSVWSRFWRSFLGSDLRRSEVEPVMSVHKRKINNGLRVDLESDCLLD
ncbi:hypothetical protein M430DRAFT_181386 [Amorphotheca resinae ATCC 22711]|uniref:Uncharacterized protein n=1 Tax=Amorphotheca resinae ATCC 22711 TaxID=857342 RepID=A0A2T3ARI4_AMORE|nr:hypothetical protein M430DRAFT_181386 [Amorphotheca resinae ATCC 22711]PSS08963.1 hypothetical protein M430DRAFT_181386 [Amorphotheca resinae ATCC 22711]